MFRDHVRYVTAKGFALALGTAVSTAFGLLVPLAYEMLGTVEGYGVYTYVLVVISLVGTSTLFGMNSAILVAAAQNKRHILRSATRRRVRFGLLLGCPILLGAGLVFATLIPSFAQVGWALLILLPVFPFLHAFTGVYSYFNGLRQFWHLALAEMVFAFLTLIVVAVGLVFMPHLVLFPPVATLAVKAAGEACLYVALVRRDGIAALDQDAHLLSYGMKVSLTGVTANVESRLDRLIVGTLYGFRDLGSFALGRAVIMPLRQIIQIYWQLYAPKLARKGPAEALRLTHRALGWGVLAAIPFFGGLYALFPWVFSTFFGKFEGAGTYARWFLGVLLAAFPFYFYYPFFQSQRQARREVIVRLTKAVVLCVGLVVLMRFFGLMGVIYAEIISMAFLSLHSWYEARKSRGVGLAEVAKETAD